MAIDFPTGNDPAADLSSVEDSPAKLALLKKLKRRKPPIITTQSFYVGDNIFQSNGNQPVPGQYLGGVAIASNQSLPVVGEYFGQPVVMGLPLEQSKVQAVPLILIPTLTLSLFPATAREGRESLAFQITGTGITGGLPVSVAIGGTAISSDYTISGAAIVDGQVTLTQGSPTVTIYINPVATGKPPRTVSLQINAGSYSISGSAIQTGQIVAATWVPIYDTWDTYSNFGWYRYYQSGNYKIIYSEPAGTPVTGISTKSFTDTITFVQAETLRIRSTGVDDSGTITLNGTTLNIYYQSVGVLSSNIRVSAGSYTISASVTNTSDGGSGIGFVIEKEVIVP